jgi:hypothetical protein
MTNFKKILFNIVEKIRLHFVHRDSSAYTRKRSLQLEALEPREMLSGVGFSSSEDAIEGIQSGYFRLERTDTVGELTVDYAIETLHDNGESRVEFAVNGVDIELLSGTPQSDPIGSITFADDEKFVDLLVEPINNSISEPTKLLRISLVPPTNVPSPYIINSENSSATINIIDDATTPKVEISEVVNAHENGEVGKFIVTRSDTVHELTVSFRVYAGNASQGDYTIENSVSTPVWQQFYESGNYRFGYSGSIKFAAGQDTVEILIRANDDVTVEQNEALELFLTDAPVVNSVSQYTLEESTRRATMQIIDNDTSRVWIDEIIDGTEGENNGQIIIKRKNTDREVTVYFQYDKDGSTAIRGEDFSNPTGINGNSRSGSVVFAQGVDTVVIDIPVLDDFKIEATEFIVFSISSDKVQGNDLPNYVLEANHDLTVKLFIRDNDVKPKVWIETSQDGTEGLADGYFRVNRDVASTPLRVSYAVNSSSTAIVGEDYESLPGTNSSQPNIGFITFAAGVYSVVIPIRAIDNQTIDGTRTVSISLLPGEEAISGVNTLYDVDESRSTQVVSIYDNDVKPVVSIVASQDAIE